MGEHGEQGDGGLVLQRAGQQQMGEGALGGRAQPLAAGIIHMNVPARQLRPHPRRQSAVGGDQRGGLGGGLQGLAHEERDGQRLLSIIGGLDEGHALQRQRHAAGRHALVEGAPGVGGVGGAQGLAEQPAPRLQGRVGHADLDHILAGSADGLQQLVQGHLRMARAGLHAPGRIAGQRGPGLVIQPGVEAGQHHSAHGRAGEGGQQAGGGAVGAGGADGHHGLVSPRRQPCDFAIDEADLPLGPVHALDLAQMLGPDGGGDAQELEGQLPVTVEFPGRDGLELRPVHALDGHLVHKARQIAREPPGMGGAGRDQGGGARSVALGAAQARGPGEDQPRQIKAALHLADGLGQIAQPVGGFRLLEHEGGFDGVDLAQRHDTRQQGHGLGGEARELQRQRAGGAAGRHIDGGARQAQRAYMGAKARDDLAVEKGLGEGREPGNPRRDRVKARGRGEGGHDQRTERSMAASASPMASGVPTCSHNPSRRRPKRRPFSAASKRKGERRKTSRSSVAKGSAFNTPTPE